jgi:outer membrane protein assembly factor BamE (lipoprotein component of BamABCDE complex)
MHRFGQLSRPVRRFRDRLLSGAAAAAIALAAGACSQTIENHGNIPDPEIVSSIRIGKTNKEQVSEMLGTPSAVSTFDKESWYYIGARTSQFAFLEPEVLERKVLVVRFDDKGVVQQLGALSKEDGRDVQVVERKTPTRGRELTIIEQLIGNVGRFSSGGGGSPSSSNPGGL